MKNGQPKNAAPMGRAMHEFDRVRMLLEQDERFEESAQGWNTNQFA